MPDGHRFPYTAVDFQDIAAAHLSLRLKAIGLHPLLLLLLLLLLIVVLLLVIFLTVVFVLSTWTSKACRITSRWAPFRASGPLHNVLLGSSYSSLTFAAQITRLLFLGSYCITIKSKKYRLFPQGILNSPDMVI